MTEMEKKRNRLLAPTVIRALKTRNMEGYFAETKEEAKEQALSLIPEGSRVGWGGAWSAKEIGLFDALREGNYETLDRDVETTPEGKDRIQHEILHSCDYFISGTNAISEDGVLVNVDGNANRVAALCCGPDHVIFIVGMNKVVKTEEDAYRRARNIAAPINAQRFGLDTPCAKLGKCMNCLHEQCICCQILTTRYSKHPGRYKVILVNENLGF